MQRPFRSENTPHCDKTYHHNNIVAAVVVVVVAVAE